MLTSLLSWISGGRRRSRTGSRGNRAKLRLECLEPRAVPAIWTVVNTSNNPLLGNLMNHTGSFPWCVEQANRDINGPIVINFDAMVVGNIDMGGSIGLQKSMTINGNGNVTVDRLATANGNFSLFIVSPTITCGIDWLTISGGKADEGGGIYNSGTLGLTNCTITGNSAGWMGGGIYNSSGATLNMFGSEVSNNHDVADGGPNPGQLSGGGIAN